MRRVTRRNIIVLVSVLFGLLIIVGRTFRMFTRPRLLPSRGTVRRVVDGDTLHLSNGLIVRLQEIDAPELFGEQSYMANEARNALFVLCYRKRVRLEAADRHMDKYGRFVAYLYLPQGKEKDAPELFVNADLVRRGYAQAKSYGAPGPHFQEIVDAEKAAKASKVGIWKSSPAKATE